MIKPTLLDKINYPADLRHLSDLELKKIAIELRNETIRTVSETGGHLGSSLGVVELTVAIHSVFNTPHDKLIWDVGHQCYPHKIITGRREKMNSLSKKVAFLALQKEVKVIMILLVQHILRRLYLPVWALL